MNVIQVYVKLLNEGTEVFRPTSALEVEKGWFRMLATPDYDPENEQWEFLPGQIVCVEQRRGLSGEFPLAVEAHEVS